MSFGCMCSTALFLRKYGFRSESTIYDWFSSSLLSNLKMLDDGFKNLLKKEYLYQPYKEFPHIVDNSFYDVSLNHIFDEYTSFKKQIKNVTKICNTRINRFMENLKSGGSLLVYYSRDEKECKWISKNQALLKGYCKKYGFDWLFITNYRLEDDFIFPNYVVPTNNIHKPYGGGVSFPFENEKPIVDYLANHYSPELIKENLKHKEKKHAVKKIIRRLKKMSGIKLKIK